MIRASSLNCADKGMLNVTLFLPPLSRRVDAPKFTGLIVPGSQVLTGIKHLTASAEFPFHVAVKVAFTDTGPLVVQFFALADAKFNLDSAFLEVE